MLISPYYRAQLEQRFWLKVNKTETCWLWIGGKSRSSGGLYYGYISIQDVMKRAHRVAYYLTYGEFGKHLCILHKCDNSLCVRPDHLFIGTEKDNNYDMINKGRQKFRVKILTKEQIDNAVTLYLEGYTLQQVGHKLGVSLQTIWKELHERNVAMRPVGSISRKNE